MFFHIVVSAMMNVNTNLYNIYEQCSIFNFKSFHISKFNCCDFENDIDPNNNFFNIISIFSVTITQ